MEVGHATLPVSIHLATHLPRESHMSDDLCLDTGRVP